MSMSKRTSSTSIFLSEELLCKSPTRVLRRKTMGVQLLTDKTVGGFDCKPLGRVDAKSQ